MCDLRKTNSELRGNDERPHSPGEREGRFASEPAASPRDLQQPERLEPELYASRLLEGFGTLVNPELAKAMVRYMLTGKKEI